MQQTTGVAVLATELPATDRRALSQAWYSALHLAERAPRARSAPLTAAMSARTNGASGSVHDACAGAGDAGGVHGAPRRATSVRGDANAHRHAGVQREDPAHRGSPALAAERRAPKSELARRLERELAQRPRGASASFAVSAAGGRVRILVRSDGARTRVVAVCAPPLRERVERALAQARFALAARGVRAEVA
jgi:hypothetical protein